MSYFIDRLNWIFLRRNTIARNVSGFWASVVSYSDSSCIFSSYNKLHSRSNLHNVRLGRFTYVSGATIGNADIGAFCCIGPGALIGGMGRHPTEWLSTHPAFYSTNEQAGLYFAEKDAYEEWLPTIIGNDVWIGARTLILEGITIGSGAIIAAGSIVTKDVPPYAIVGGVPAKIIRYRFSPEVIAELLDWCWWDLPDTALKNIYRRFIEREKWTVEDVRAIRLAVQTFDS